MSTPQEAAARHPPPRVPDATTSPARRTLAALEQLLGGLGTALLALLVLALLVIVALASLIGVGLLAMPVALRTLHGLADRERARLGRWGPEVITAGPAPLRLRPAAADPTTRRELGWLVPHATLGLLLGLAGLSLPLYALRDITFPLWWLLLPPPDRTASPGFWVVDTWPGALAVSLLGLGWLALTVGATPVLARLQAAPGRRLLGPGPNADLPLQVAHLTATRAAALDAHASELRRIERSLHDGAQNRLVAVAVLVGAARRALVRDPSSADAILEQAQGAAELALGELRAVARAILPPVLADRGLAGALTGLAAACPVPCQVDVEVPRRCAASVEATAYFVVAEALTNIARHSGARHATVTVRLEQDRLQVQVSDDGQGGAEEGRGSGLSGARRRVEAHDGTFSLTSPRGGPTVVQGDLPCGS